MKMKSNIRKSLQNLLLLLQPPKRQTVSEWAEENRRLPAGSAFPGRWSNSLTPYLVEIMDTYNDPAVRETIYVKPTQVGGTVTCENIIGKIIHHDPSPTMMIYPDDTAAKSIVQGKFQPMFQDSPVLAERWNERKSKILEQRFTGMTLYFTGTKTAQKVASKNIRNLFFDELDKITNTIKGEGDVIALAEERVKTFGGRYKIFKASTPTTKYGRIWKAMQAADIIRKPRVRCPHCNEFIELKMSQLKWQKTDAGNDVTSVWYVCQECGGVIEEKHRMPMIRTVRWFTVTENRQRRERVAYWMNTLYSPFVTWEQIALKWLDAQGDQSKLQNFINSWLAEPWVEATSELEIDVITKRQTSAPRLSVPEWAELLTGGVDVQRGSLYYKIDAWGPHLTKQTIDNGQVLGFEDIERVMNLEYKKPDGSAYVVSLCGIDSGDGETIDDVYQFCVQNAEWAIPVKGASGRMYGWYKLSKIDRAGSSAHGHQLLIVDTSKYKDMIASRYQRENGNGSFMVYQDVDKEYASQLTSEYKITDSGVWEKKGSHRDNHYLDADVYSTAVADLLGARSMHLDQVPQEQQPVAPQIPQQNDWIRGGG